MSCLMICEIVTHNISENFLISEYSLDLVVLFIKLMNSHQVQKK